MNLSRCRVCQNTKTKLHSISPQLPIYIWPLKTPYPKGHELADAGLYVCLNCGHLQLQDLDELFIAKLYDRGSFLEDERAVKEARLGFILKSLGQAFFEGKRVLDVGGGNNPFAMFLPKSENWIVDIDPSQQALNLAHHVVRGRFEEATVDDKHFDTILSFHSLEHFGNPSAVVEKMARTLKDDGVVIVEVPHISGIINTLPYYAIFHQHLSLFTLSSLDTLFGRQGLIRLQLIRNDDVILAVYKKGQTKENFTGASSGIDLADRLRVKLLSLDLALKSLVLNCGRSSLGLYGAGGGASLFLANFPWLRDRIEFSFDRDQRKQNRYLPGTAVKVSAPEDIRDSNVETLLFLSAPVFQSVSKQVPVRCVDISANLLELAQNFKKGANHVSL